MADFDLIQTDAQVQSILNDGQNMQGAGAQTTLTTESVLLKDVNGNYHKILKSSFTEAIRDTLAGLLVNNDKGTTINQIAAIANGDFGSITPANLASVLGGVMSSLRWHNELLIPGGEARTISLGNNVLVYYVATGIDWGSGLFLLDYDTISIIKAGTSNVEVTCPSSGNIQFENKSATTTNIYYFYIALQ